MKVATSKMPPQFCTRFSSVWRSPTVLILSLISGFLSLISGSICFAQDDAARSAAREMRLPPRSVAQEATSSSRKSTSAGSGLWTTVISLAAIGGTLGTAAYWLRPYLGAARGLPIEAMELLGRRMIEQKVAVHLIRCGGKVLVVGISPEGARTLSEITDPVEVQRLVKACHAPRENRPAVTTFDSREAGSPADGSDHLSLPPGMRTVVSRASSFPSEEQRRA